MKYLFLPLLFVLFNAYSQQAMFHAHNKNVSSATYVEDVFSAYTYTGNGTTQTITNGIDLSTHGGLVWTKGRNNTEWNYLIDNVRGITKFLHSNSTNAEGTGVSMINSFNSNGYSIGNSSGFNLSNNTMASWTFRKAAKFFDVVTYTGDGVNGRQIPHNLGIAPGMVIIKRTDASENWVVCHRGSGSGNAWVQLSLNSTSAGSQGTPQSSLNSTTLDVTNYTGASSSPNGCNTSGATYVAYVFAHDAAANGLIQCGSFTVSSGVANVNIGWEPQFLLAFPIAGGSNWQMLDVARGWSESGYNTLVSNTSTAESSPGSADYRKPMATGFKWSSTPDGTYIYMAIRRGPMKTPTAGTQVYNAIADNHTQTARSITTVGFAPDMMLNLVRSNANYGQHVLDRLRGPSQNLYSEYISAETTQNGTAVTSFDMDGVSLGVDNAGTGINAYSGYTSSKNFFKRAPGFFDEVCYSGTGAAMTITHNLGVSPELIIVKDRSAAGLNWAVWASNRIDGYSLVLNSTNVQANNGHFPAGNMTSTTFNVANNSNVSGSGDTYVAYLFATVPGVSKVGSYTGNGANQTIACGFASSARFVLIKRTDAVGDWFVWDTVRGIVAGNDPHLSLNTPAVEVTTDDSIDPDSSGFIVNQDAATNINVNSATYIFLAIN